MSTELEKRLEYNSRDCLATRRLFDEISSKLDPETSRVYTAFMGLQGVCSAVQWRGLRVDLKRRKQIVAQLKLDVARKEQEISQLAGYELNPRSPLQLGKFFYADCGLRTQKAHKTEKVTTNEEALTRISKRAVAVDGGKPKTESKDKAAAVAKLILECRDLGKQASSLADGLLENGRMRTTLVPGGTESYRLSAHKSNTGKGFNQQNVDKRLRGCYVADPGFILVQQDQASAESMCVAYLADDQKYIDAHLAGSTHVVVARMLWPEIAWTGDNKKDKALAKETKAPGGTLAAYDLAKRVQHGLNYMLSVHGLAHHAGMTLKMAEQVMGLYFGGFPGIPAWHKKVISELRETGVIHCPGGYKRVFFGRRSDEGTWREAISFIPQSVIAWNNHIVFARLYHHLESSDFQVLGHIHDAVIWQARRGEVVRNVCPRVAELSRVQWPINGRIMEIRWEWSFGRNWAEIS